MHNKKFKIENKKEMMIVLTYIKNAIIKSNVDENENSHSLKYKKVIGMLDRIYKGTYGKTHLWNTTEVKNIKWNELADCRTSNTEFFNSYFIRNVENEVMDLIIDGLEIYANIPMENIQNTHKEEQCVLI